MTEPTTPGGTAASPQATAIPHVELVEEKVWPRAILPSEWQTLKDIVELLRTHPEGRIANRLYEALVDQWGCIHITIGRPQDT